MRLSSADYSKREILPDAGDRRVVEVEVEEEGSTGARLAFAKVEEEHVGWDCCCWYCWDEETFPVDVEGCTDSLVR
jgi:hypothetical protein